MMYLNSKLFCKPPLCLWQLWYFFPSNKRRLIWFEVLMWPVRETLSVLLGLKSSWAVGCVLLSSDHFALNVTLVFCLQHPSMTVAVDYVSSTHWRLFEPYLKMLAFSADEDDNFEMRFQWEVVTNYFIEQMKLLCLLVVREKLVKTKLIFFILLLNWNF